MSEPQEFIYLSREDLEALEVSTAESVASIEHLLREQHAQRAWAPPKTAVMIPDGRYMMATLAAADDPPLQAVKSVVLNPRNSERGLPQINSMVMLLDGETGLPVAVLDGNWVTAIRTSGLSAVAAKRLARPDSSVVAFIGCGVQAHSHLQAFSELFPLREIRAFGRGSANRDALCEAARGRGYTALASATGQEAIEGADIVVTSVTLSAELDPFLDASGLKPGAFAAVTDFARPWRKEGLASLDRIIVDDIEQERSTAYPMVDPKLVQGDLLGLVCGDAAGRESDTERNAFLFRGMAVGDLALAALAYRKAKERAKGSAIR